MAHAGHLRGGAHVGLPGRRNVRRRASPNGPKTKFRSIRMTAGERRYPKAEYAYKIGVCKGIDLEHWKRLGCDASGFMHTSPYTTSLPPAFQAKKGKSYYVGTIGTMATDQAAGNEEVKIEMRTWNDRFGGRWNTVIPEKTLEATPECQSDRRNSICKVQWHQSAGWFNLPWKRRQELKDKYMASMTKPQ